MTSKKYEYTNEKEGYSYNYPKPFHFGQIVYRLMNA